ncbi:MAG: ATP-binding protein [Yoonia sp.]|uniref:ATP-binding protein n=1 Tax=Yoonia sp. TaxID=2212373 RepID=UPI0032635DEB
MFGPILSRSILMLAFMAMTAIVCGGVWSFGYGAAVDQLEKRGRADLALAASRLTGELQRFRSLAVLTADRPEIMAILQGISSPQVSGLLREMADKTGSLDILIVGVAGEEILSSSETVGVDHAQRPYFERAMDGALGVYHFVDPRYDRRVFYFAAPVFADAGPVMGVVIVAVDVGVVETAWRGDELAVFFTDELGVVFISNRSELVYRTKESDIRMVGQSAEYPTGLITPFVRHNEKQFRSFEVWEIDGGRYLPEQALHLTLPMPVIDLVGEALPDLAPARQLAYLQTIAAAAIMLAFGAVLFWVTERRRTLAFANADLERRVAKRTAELEAVNADLQRTQAELVQAEKLSALGQMSAGISHELNQPLMAIQSFAENGTALMQQGRHDVADQNLGRISDLARRMARIIRNLRAFARNENEPLVDVDLRAVVHETLDMLAARFAKESVVVNWTPPNSPVHVRGGEVRLQQVVLNLMTNAADAMDGLSHRQLDVTVTQADKTILSIRDTGPGIAEPDRIFDPFYSTKSIGAAEGMGLGLSISYGLVQSFGGDIQGRNHPDGGAEFSVMLQPVETT